MRSSSSKKVDTERTTMMYIYFKTVTLLDINTSFPGTSVGTIGTTKTHKKHQQIIHTQEVSELIKGIHRNW